MLCGIELQEVSNSEGSQVVAVTRKPEVQAVTETVTVSKQQQVNATQQQSVASSSSRKYDILIMLLLPLCTFVKLIIVHPSVPRPVCLSLFLCLPACLPVICFMSALEFQILYTVFLRNCKNL